MPSNRQLTLPPGDGDPDTGQGSIFFIGTATVLIRYAGFTILTDPNFIHMHETVPIGYGLTARRLTNPAMEIGDLPPLDLVVLSHFHGDHFDQVAERELDKSVPIVTTPHAARALRERGFRATHSLGKWASITASKGNAKVTITAAPGSHGPGIMGTLLPPVMGSILEFESGESGTLVRLYITGDTLLIDQLKEIPLRYPEIDIALLHLGGTRALGIMVTMDGKQGVQVMRRVRPRLAIPIHYNDYDLFKSPLSDFQKRVKDAGLERRVKYLAHGETYTFQPASMQKR
ncbi:MAG TPA: MBL fold metallo-hydrolase [Chloroflexia bacterium]|nr:MBL fold metallo-hydrolase [Chloroflexia bacterium]